MEQSNSTFAEDLASSSTKKWTPYVFTLVAFYAVLCSLLRYQRRDALHKKLGLSDRRPLSEMTVVEAQSITAHLAEFEFPKIFYTSIQFALFKVRTQLEERTC